MENIDFEDVLLKEFGTTNKAAIAYKIALDINENGDKSCFCIEDIIGFLGDFLND